MNVNSGGWSRGTAHRCAVRALAVVFSLGLVAGCGDTEITPPEPSADQDGRVVAAQRTLDRLEQALGAADVGAAVDLATPGSEELLKAVAANAEALGLEQLSLRYVDQAMVPTALPDGSPDGAWVAAVELGYVLPKWDPGPTRLETSVVLAPVDGEQRIVKFGAGADRTPLWLTGALSVRSSERVLSLAHDPDRAQALLRMGQDAVADVEQVIPSWNGSLVLVRPRSSQQLHAALSAEPGQYANIAAVTTAADGALVEDAPVHVFVNPEVFGRLGEKGAQVVISHEAAHVATGAATSRAPKWLVEGFADYVGLKRAGVPLSEAAGQVLAQVRRDGPPDDLPSPADLAPSAADLGATYEEAWLACRFIAQQYGEERLVAFYRAVDGGVPLEDAFADVLGTSRATFVDAWSEDVAALADSGGATDG